MKIVVAIKQVLDPSGIGVNRRSGRITVNRESYLIDPAAKNALEAALRLKDTAGAEVIALTLGPERASDALYEALGMGADRAIDVQDGAFRRADAVVATRALAQAVKHIRAVDLVVVGERALDTDDGQVGPRLAEALGWPLLSRALKLEVDSHILRIVKQVETGHVAEEADLPAVVTIPRDSHPPRYAHGAHLFGAYQDGNIEHWSAAALGLVEADLEPLAHVRGAVLPPERQVGLRLAGTTEEVAVKLATQLYDRLGLRR
jgi:electron transfer flavoprotein beta subunit